MQLVGVGTQQPTTRLLQQNNPPQMTTTYLSFLNQISVQVRSNLSSYNAKNWKNVDVATRDVVLQNIAVNLH